MVLTTLFPNPTLASLTLLLLLQTCSSYTPVRAHTTGFASKATELRAAATAIPLPSIKRDEEKTDAPKIGVLLLNLGGPETGDDVEGER
jgi:hypothetical protein